MALPTAMHSISRNEYDLVKSSPTDSSSSEIDDDEGQSFAGEKWRASRGVWQHPRLVVATLLNILLFVASATMFGSWFYHTHIQLNGKLRQAASSSEF